MWRDGNFVLAAKKGLIEESTREIERTIHFILRQFHQDK